MKRKGFLLLAILMLTVFMTACGGASSEEPKVNPDVNSGVVDENYVGDPAPVLEENYLQSPADEKVQKEVLDKIKEQDNSEDGPTVSGI